jgi:hypothetical protein
MRQRPALPAHRHPVTKKVRITGQLTLELNIIASLLSIALQYGAPLEKVGDLLAGAQCAPCGWHLEIQCWKQWTEQTT